MKFLLFADLHHAPGVFMSGSWEDLREIQAAAERENCDFIIHAGDFCHGPVTKAPEFTKAYNDFHIPGYHCLGNHDADGCTYEETVKAYHMPNGYYYFDVKGYRMIVVNPNYFKVGEEYFNYSNGNYFQHGSERDWVPPEQLAWLEATIAEAPHPCILISHESFERPDGVKNREDVLKIINRANERKPHSVLMCINGHYHRDYLRIMDNVAYFDVNSVRMDWLSHAPHDFYPEELCAQYKHMRKTVYCNDPLYCIVSVEGTTIDIKGRRSTPFRGITREMTDNPPFDRAGRPRTCEIKSAKFTLE